MASCGSQRNWFVHWMSIIGIGVGGVALILAVFVMRREGQWVHPRNLDAREAFSEGTIGTELLPLPVAAVLGDLVADRRHFAPLGPDAGDWIEQFGFLRADGTGGSGLPHGFTLSNYRPRSGAPSPVPFVGIGCATCHTSEIIRSDGSRFLVTGTGNASLNLFAWLDAVQAALLEKRDGAYIVTVDSIVAAYEKRSDRKLDFAEKQMTRLWLKEFRETLESGLPRFDDPFGHGQSLAPRVTPTGPGRTQPFRTLVRGVLNRPGNDMHVYTKIAAVYHEEWQEWAQVDGGVRGLNHRSALAVLAAGATLQNMQVPEIRSNIEKATDFIRTLSGPRFVEVFPETRLDVEAAARGERHYLEHCAKCHGRPGAGGAWLKGGRFGEVVPVAEIGTDPERVSFRHLDELPEKIYAYFPEKHPFKLQRDDIRTTGGYINKPLDSAFTRAPYLHNASVLTLAELINLKKRRTTFYRGRNMYDTVGVGLRSPDQPDAEHYFRFDTSVAGNSNAGHDYPWPYQAPDWNAAALRDLLEFLKTL